MSGQFWISHDEIAGIVGNLRSLATTLEEATQRQAHNLSRRQQQIMEAIAAGCPNKDIAKELSISERTVKYHLTRLFKTFGVSGRMELARSRFQLPVRSLAKSGTTV